MMLKELTPPRISIGAEQLGAIADRAEGTLAKLRDDLLEPWPRKMAPIVTGARLAKLCKLDRTQINYLCTRGHREGLPVGTLKGTSRNREFTLAEAQEFVRMAGPYKPRPTGTKGIVLSVGNFKGGVGKTTMAVAIAQALTLHGHKVLLIDLDPQASSTTLMGYVPTPEVSEEMTVMPVVYGEQPDLTYAAIPSYWNNLDIIPSSAALFGADYYLPNKQATDPQYEFWKVLDSAMGPIRETYDVVVIDTPPTLSYLAIGCFMATDGMVIPLPPETLDYASSTQFFRQFSELFKTLSDRSVEKAFAFIKVVLSKVKPGVATTDVVKSWIQQTYPELLARAEVLETDLVKNAAAEFKTIYDLTRYEGSTATFNRALESFDSVVDEIEAEIQNTWALQLAEVTDGE
ncbi:Iron-sulfur cluster carrier protein [Paraburkholderia humisilvae]|uniref:Iron-sulfur cluster carrier protein n=2 Tax=Paraburkholderia humisilvae TaxID=627669 RepID=A0A6J5F0D2_9BURK|nr:Iron-sulfur cluster carrier protein [Paraburkholderia humisilvae]